MHCCFKAEVILVFEFVVGLAAVIYIFKYMKGDQ